MVKKIISNNVSTKPWQLASQEEIMETHSLLNQSVIFRSSNFYPQVMYNTPENSLDDIVKCIHVQSLGSPVAETITFSLVYTSCSY